MKLIVAVSALVVVVMAAVAMARPDTILDFEGDNHQHYQSGEAGDSVEGSYSWKSPEGVEFYVKYVADDDGYRVVESNAIPVSHDGHKADGNQGSFDGDDGGEGGEEGGEK